MNLDSVSDFKLPTINNEVNGKGCTRYFPFSTFHFYGTPLPLEIRRIETLHEIIIIKLMHKKPR